MLVIAVVALGTRFGALRFALWLQRLHYRLTAETPQLVFKQTPLNAKLLERCETMSTLPKVVHFLPDPNLKDDCHIARVVH